MHEFIETVWNKLNYLKVDELIGFGFGSFCESSFKIFALIHCGLSNIFFVRHIQETSLMFLYKLTHIKNKIFFILLPTNLPQKFKFNFQFLLTN